MSIIDKSINFIPINIGVITISDTRTDENDKSGNLLKKRINSFGHNVLKNNIIQDDIDLIKKTILDFSKDPLIDAVITTGWNWFNWKRFYS